MFYYSTGRNMDPDIITINLPSDEASYLIGMLNKNCEAAEQLAIEAVAGMDMPFLNPLRELTKGECLQILVSFIIWLFNKIWNSHVVLPLTSSSYDIKFKNWFIILSVFNDFIILEARIIWVSKVTEVTWCLGMLFGQARKKCTHNIGLEISRGHLKDWETNWKVT